MSMTVQKQRKKQFLIKSKSKLNWNRPTPKFTNFNSKSKDTNNNLHKRINNSSNKTHK